MSEATPAESLVVSEVFGPTWQGEGPSLGRLCAFVRLGRCNLACCFCDTRYTWDWEHFDPGRELVREQVADIIRQIEAMSSRRGKPHLLYPGEVCWDRVLQPGPKLIVITDAKQPGQVLYSDTIVCGIDITDTLTASIATAGAMPPAPLFAGVDVAASGGGTMPVRVPNQ